ERRGTRDEQRADDRVDRPAARHLPVDARHVGAQEARGEQPQPAGHDDPHERDERDHRERKGCRDEDLREEVRAAPARVDLEQLGVHPLAPEKSLRRATIARATKFTAKVMTKSASPVAIRTLTLRPEASGNCAAMFAAMVWCWPGCRRKKE